MVTKYHSLTGAQGRGVGAGYNRFRYDQPVSTFVSRPAMQPAAEPADEVARKAVAETPTPVDTMRELSRQEQTPGGRDVPSSIGDYAPANDWEASIDRAAFGNPLGDFAIDRATNVGVNLATAKMAGIPSEFYGGIVKSSVAPPPMSALGKISDFGTSMAAADQVKRSDYGKMLAGYDVSAHESIDELGVEQYTPAPDDIDRFMAHQASLDEVKARTEPLLPSLSPPAFGQIVNEFVVEPITRKPITTIFDPVVVPERYRSLLGEDATGDSSEDGNVRPKSRMVSTGELLGNVTAGSEYEARLNELSSISGLPRRSYAGLSLSELNKGIRQAKAMTPLTVDNRFESERWGQWADKDVEGMSPNQSISGGAVGERLSKGDLRGGRRSHFDDMGRGRGDRGGRGIGPGGSGSRGLGGGSATDSMGGGYGDDADGGYW